MTWLEPMSGTGSHGYEGVPETLAYVAAFDPDRKTPDLISVVDVDWKSTQGQEECW